MSTQPYGVDLDPDSEPEVQADTTICIAIDTTGTDVTGIDWDQEVEELTQASEDMEIAEPEADVDTVVVENLPPSSSRFVKVS